MSSDSISKQDLYAYDGNGGKTGQQCGDGTGDSCTNSAVKNWHPDYSLSSPEAREWYKQNQQSRILPLNLNSDGTYTVQKSDCLETIAERDLRKGGAPVGKQAIDKEVQQIIALNHEQYKDLDCNKEFLGSGWRLHMPGKPAPDCPTADSHPPKHHPPRHEPVAAPVDQTYARQNDDSYRYQQQQQQRSSDGAAGAAIAAGLVLPLLFGASRLFQRRDDYYEPGYYGGYNGYRPYQQQQYYRQQHEWREQRHHQYEQHHWR